MGYYFYLYISYISLISSFLPVVAAFYKRRILTKDEFILLILFSACSVIQLTAFFLHKQHINNLALARIYTWVRFLLLAFYFYTIFQDKIIRYLVPIFLLIFLIIATVDLNRNGINSMPSISMTVESLLVLIFTFVGIFNLINNPTNDSVFSVPRFWFYVAFLIYFSGNLFLFILNTYILQKSAKLHYEVWAIHSVLNILYNSLVSIGFLKIRYGKEKIQAGPGR